MEDAITVALEGCPPDKLACLVSPFRFRMKPATRIWPATGIACQLRDGDIEGWDEDTLVLSEKWLWVPVM